MARFFTHKNGRLKTGRVAVLIFAGLLIAFGMFFKINSSVDHALLAVKHVFEPGKVQPTKEKPVIKQKIAQIKPPANKKADPKDERLPEKPQADEKRKVDPQGNKKTEPATTQQATVEMSPAQSPTAEKKTPFARKNRSNRRNKTTGKTDRRGFGKRRIRNRQGQCFRPGRLIKARPEITGDKIPNAEIGTENNQRL